MAFQVQTATPSSLLTVLRVTYSDYPLAAAVSGANDALNASNYRLAGPATVYVTSVVHVEDDPLSVDLQLSAALTAGSWTVTVLNVRTPDGTALASPLSLVFTVSGSPQEQVSLGARGTSAEATLRKNMTPAIGGPAIAAMLAAMAQGDVRNRENAKAAYDQLFVSTASGVYLDRKTADNGITRPSGIGMGDDLYRRYAIKVTANKLTQQVILEALEVFYGSDALRSFITSGSAEPFALSDRQDLMLELDRNTSVNVVFSTADFGNIGAAKAIEVATAINRTFRTQNLKHFATVFSDPVTGTNKVRIYTASLGLRGAVAVIGGRAQNILQFSDPLLTRGGTQVGVGTGETWSVSIPQAGTMRLTVSGSATVDLSGVEVGDYVNIYGSGFSSVNQGSFAITAVDYRYSGGILVQYVEALNPLVSAQSVVIGASTDLMFFRPSVQTINGSRAVIVSQPDSETVDVILPATTVAVNRVLREAAYLQPTTILNPTGIQRINGTVTLTFSSPHGLLAGQQIFVDGAAPADSVPADTAASSGVSSANAVSSWASIDAQTGTAIDGARAATLTGGKVLVVGGRNTQGLGGPYLSARTTARLFAITGSSSPTSGGTQYNHSWTNAASIPVGREYHTVSALTDVNQGGNALVVGGWDGDSSLGGGGTNTPMASSYIYNVGGNTWSSAINLGTARCLHSATVLQNGQVLIAGGATSNTATTASAELFTASGGGGSFATGNPMSVPRQQHAAVLLASGKVLVIGGRQLTGGATITTGIGTILPTCEIYDPGTNTWSKTGSMTYARYWPAAMVLPNNQVLVTGGYGFAANSPGAATALKTAEIYDGNSGRWFSVDAMPDTVSPQDAALSAFYLSASNQVLVCGDLKTSAYFQVDTRRWRRTPRARSDVRSMGAAALLQNGTVLYAGGVDGTSHASSLNAGLFAPASDSIAATGLNGQHTVSAVPSSTTLQYVTSEKGFSQASSGLSVLVAAASPGVFAGPFILDPEEGVSITATTTTTAVALNSGQRYRTLVVANGGAQAFPDEAGYVVIGFGTSQQVGPIPYLGKVSDSELILDYGFQFQVSVDSGASVTLLQGKAPYNPDNANQIGAFYLTDSNAGRVAAEDAVNDIVAAGSGLNVQVRYPGDRGLAGEGLPTSGTNKLSDRVVVWGSNDLDTELTAARAEVT